MKYPGRLIAQLSSLRDVPHNVRPGLGDAPLGPAHAFTGLLYLQPPRVTLSRSTTLGMIWIVAALPRWP
jgi:hypothetical protein